MQNNAQVLTCVFIDFSCSSLHTFWFCVARNVPQCFYNVSVRNEHFTHSPHYCNLSREQFLQLQDIIHSQPKGTTISLPASVSGEDSYDTVTSHPNKDVKDGEHSDQKGNKHRYIFNVNINVNLILGV